MAWTFQDILGRGPTADENAAADGLVRLGPLTRKLGQYERAFAELPPEIQQSPKGVQVRQLINDASARLAPLYRELADVFNIGKSRGYFTDQEATFRTDFGDLGLSFDAWIFIGVAAAAAVIALAASLGFVAIAAVATTAIAIAGSVAVIGAVMVELLNRNALPSASDFGTAAIKTGAGVGLAFLALALFLFVKRR